MANVSSVVDVVVVVEEEEEDDDDDEERQREEARVERQRVGERLRKVIMMGGVFKTPTSPGIWGARHLDMNSREIGRSGHRSDL